MSTFQSVRPVVLLVEDEPTLGQVLAEALTDHGYTVHQTDKPEDAVTYLSCQANRVDVLLTDIKMPVITGAQLCIAATEIRPGIKVLFMTGFTDYNALISENVRKRTEVIRKPFTTDELCSRVDSMLAFGYDDADK